MLLIKFKEIGIFFRVFSISPVLAPNFQCSHTHLVLPFLAQRFYKMYYLVLLVFLLLQSLLLSFSIMDSTAKTTAHLLLLSVAIAGIWSCFPQSYMHAIRVIRLCTHIAHRPTMKINVSWALLVVTALSKDAALICYPKKNI